MEHRRVFRGGPFRRKLTDARHHVTRVIEISAACTIVNEHFCHISIDDIYRACVKVLVLTNV